VMEGAELVLEETPATGRCRACGEESRLDGFPLACRECGGHDIEVVAGEELRVESLDLEEEVVYGN
jgi:hydrogenase nickel incorporation protein HypA/HybF